MILQVSVAIGCPLYLVYHLVAHIPLNAVRHFRLKRGCFRGYRSTSPSGLISGVVLQNVELGEAVIHGKQHVDWVGTSSNTDGSQRTGRSDVAEVGTTHGAHVGTVF